MLHVERSSLKTGEDRGEKSRIAVLVAAWWEDN